MDDGRPGGVVSRRHPRARHGGRGDRPQSTHPPVGHQRGPARLELASRAADLFLLSLARRHERSRGRVRGRPDAVRSACESRRDGVAGGARARAGSRGRVPDQLGSRARRTSMVYDGARRRRPDVSGERERRRAAGADAHLRSTPADHPSWPLSTVASRARDVRDTPRRRRRTRQLPVVVHRYAGIATPDPRTHSNNMYLELLADTGLVGAAAFAWLLWATRACKVTNIGVVCALVAIALHGLVDSFLSFGPTYVLFALTLGLACAEARGL